MVRDDLDLVFERVVGGGGWWQWRQTLLLGPTYLSTGLPLLLHLFAAYTPRHRCRVNGCDPAHASFDESFLNFSIPKNRAGSNFLSDSVDYDPCRMYRNLSSDDSCTPDNFDRFESVQCVSYVYDTTEFSSTLTTELDLVCDDVSRRHLLGSVMMLGLTLGSLLGGPLGDRFGRKKALFTGICIAIPSVFAGGFVNDYHLYLLLRLISCTVIVFGWIACHNLQIEYFDKGHRRLSYGFSSALHHVTGCLLPALVYLVPRDRESMHVWVAMVAAVTAAPVYAFVSESPRWLACNGRGAEAELMILEIARVNGRKLTPSHRSRIRAVLERAVNSNNSTSKENLSPLHMFHKKMFGRTAILFSCWICTMVTLYALVLNVEDLSGDIFLNFFLGALVDIPAQLAVMLVVDKIGRKRSLFVALFSLGLCCLVMSVLDRKNASAVRIVYLLGRFCASASGNVCWLITSELYPTNLRSQAVGTCSMVARIFGMSSSFLSELPMPMVLLGVPAVSAAFLALRLPETRGRALPETMEEAIRLGEKKDCQQQVQQTKDEHYQSEEEEEKEVFDEDEELLLS